MISVCFVSLSHETATEEKNTESDHFLARQGFIIMLIVELTSAIRDSKLLGLMKHIFCCCFTTVFSLGSKTLLCPLLEC